MGDVLGAFAVLLMGIVFFGVLYVLYYLNKGAQEVRENEMFPGRDGS